MMGTQSWADGVAVQETQTKPTQDAVPTTGGTAPRATAVVVAVVVTWNRKEMVAGVIDALVAQARACPSLHVVVVDNSSTDGTSDYLTKKYSPERVVRNATEAALSPSFVDETANEAGNVPGFASFTVVRNLHNLGGCGGFNTGFKYVEHRFGRFGSQDAPDFVWLLDDDIDLPAEALTKLLDAAKSDQSIALVGSRTVDIGDRRSTIESTIYFDPASGLMGPDPAPGHEFADEHQRWIDDTRDEAGNRVFSGVRDVDIVSACSMLARWRDVCKVGFWDERFFIYCDDADWCLRFRGQGKRVVCALDAIVFHTPWTHKLTSERGYYLNRNLAWMIRHNVKEPMLRRTLFKWAARLMSQAKTAILNRRIHEADLLMRAVSDSIRSKGGKLDTKPTDRYTALQALGACNALGKNVVLVCPGRHAYMQAELFRAHVINGLVQGGRASEIPKWIVLAHVDSPAPEHGGESPAAGQHRPELRFYEHDRFNKLDAQLDWLRHPPQAVVVFDGKSDFPMLRGMRTMHVSSNDYDAVRVERDGLRVKLGLIARWFVLGVRVVWSVLRAKRIEASV
ncbi:MAG: glycosyltransferase family 2 protein [Phycisphaera sp.]|nr:MAG: glycosyltransferase family 2 protein [Phycisphaera sp.]